MIPDVEVEYILTECFIELGRHVGDRVVSPEAARFWRDRYRQRFWETLTRERRRRVWQHDRLNVLAKAAALGRTACRLAEQENSLVITEAFARRASDANDCRPATQYGAFSVWCLPPGQASESPIEDVATAIGAPFIPAAATTY
jgi:hypothetical protein